MDDKSESFIASALPSSKEEDVMHALAELAGINNKSESEDDGWVQKVLKIFFKDF